MALTSVTSGNQAAASDLNQFKTHLEGGSGSTVAYLLRTASGNDFIVVLSDNAGAQVFSVRDSADVQVAMIDSNGNLDLDGTITAGSGSNQIVTAAGLVDGTKLAPGTAAYFLRTNAGATATEWAVVGTAGPIKIQVFS